MKISSLFKSKSKIEDPSVLDEDTANAIGQQGLEGTSTPDATEQAATSGKKPKGLSGLFKKKQPVEPEDTPIVMSGDPVQMTFDDRGVFAIGKKKFAAGLVWVPTIVGNSMKMHVEIAEKVAKSQKLLEFDFTFVTGTVKDDLIGFGTKDLGHIRGLPSLVKSIDASVAGKNWLIAVKIENRDIWWVGSVRDDIVFLDRIFTNDESAMIVFSDAMVAPGWDTIIAPSDWNIPGARPSLVSNIVKKTDVRLRVYDPIKVYGPRILMSSALLLVLSGGAFYLWNEQKKFDAEQAEIRARIERAVTLQPSDFPWFAKLSVAQFVEKCSEEIQNTLKIVTGWENQVFSCTIDKANGNVVTGWEHAGGSIAMLRASLPADFPELSVTPTVNRVVIDRSFPVEKVEGDQLETAWEQDEIEKRLPERFQTKDITYTLRFVRDTRAPETNPLFNRHDVQITTAASPIEMAPLLDDIPALIPQTLTFNLATSMWNLIVRVHHPVILPEIEQP